MVVLMWHLAGSRGEPKQVGDLRRQLLIVLVRAGLIGGWNGALRLVTS